MKMIKVKDLTIGQVIAICKKHISCKGCPLENIDASVCHIALSRDELNKEIKVDD